jgi:hypothetical protein
MDQIRRDVECTAKDCIRVIELHCEVAQLSLYLVFSAVPDQDNNKVHLEYNSKGVYGKM